MVKTINTEKSEFIQSVIEKHSSIRSGQYSKFLDENQIYVTYLSVNEAMSTADYGTGNIDNIYGPNSPIRYNRINHFPLYNFPELKPEFDINEDFGADISMELSGLTLLPGTIKPNIYDSIIVEYPNAPQMLFRINQFEFNGIQSNDFYTLSVHLAALSEGENVDIIEQYGIQYQIVETYETIFENIGTQNSCFIRSDKVDEINGLVQTIDTLKKNYLNKFLDPTSNSFILRENVVTLKKIIEVPDPVQIEGAPTIMRKKVEEKTTVLPYALYDPYLEKFITETHLFETGDSNFSICLTPNDVLPSNFNHIYQKSIWYMLERKSVAYTTDYMYFYFMPVKKFTSPFVMYSMNILTCYLLEKGIPMFNIDESIKKMRFEALTELDRFFSSFKEEEYSTSNWKDITKILERAKVDIYSTDDKVRIYAFVAQAKTEMGYILSIEKEYLAKYIEKLIHYQNHIDSTKYTEENWKEIQGIVQKYIKTLYNSPHEIHESLTHKCKEEILEIPRIGEENTNGPN